MSFDYNKLKQVPFNGFYNEKMEKSQIYLHHTAGGPSGEQVFRFWESDTQQHVATCVCISQDGTIVQGFPSEKWAFHLGIKSSIFTDWRLPYLPLDKMSIGIEICNYGPLTWKDGKFTTYVGSVIPESQVCKLEVPFKGQKYWQHYTKAQIDSVVALLKLWNKRYGIPLTYNEDIWDMTTRALRGEKGIFTHNSVRKDKTDVYPHPLLIEALKSL
jgi:N-acetyl-anhydromuramyl-L-alanine amidase AmpD